MARQAYAEDQNIHNMTTRQLREYIYQKSREAQARLDSIKDLKETSRAFQNQVRTITNARGKVKKSTSNMTKAEMREYAYDLRQFESLDTDSGFAKSIEWKENKQKYETFIRNQMQDPLTRDYWKQYITEKGNVSKRGYEDYKKYISFIKNSLELVNAYGYETLKEYGVQATKDPERGKVIEKLLQDIYFQNKGKGLTQSQLNEAFHIALAEYDKRKKQEEVKKTKAPSGKPSKAKTKKKVGTIKKAKKKKSSGTIKTKTVGKMKTSATVRR